MNLPLPGSAGTILVPKFLCVVYGLQNSETRSAYGDVDTGSGEHNTMTACGANISLPAACYLTATARVKKSRILSSKGSEGMPNLFNSLNRMTTKVITANRRTANETGFRNGTPLEARQRWLQIRGSCADLCALQSSLGDRVDAFRYASRE